ncbi:MAG: hypothetical protein ABJN26_12620 [Stappiaceae bacterium]
MTIENIAAQLASSLGHTDESANIELAEALCQSDDQTAVAFVVDILETGTKTLRKDAIKVLYEVGARRPELIVPHTDVFFDGIDSRDNRIVWGALKALAKICTVSPDSVADRLNLVLKAADNGSVIAKDQAVEILVSLKSLPKYTQVASSELFSRLRTAAINQLPRYAEITAANLLPSEMNEFLSILEMRLADPMSESSRRRLRKVAITASSVSH